MGIYNLQTFVEGGHMEGVAESAELLQIARTLQGRFKNGKQKAVNKRLNLVLDAECCLDRLYGGFFSDWTCGGQWNRMMNFLNQLFTVCQKGHIDFTVAFNGAFESQRMAEWVQLQHSNRQKNQLIFRHLQNKGTPPPKVWWLTPACLSTSLRLALRYLNVPMLCSMDDHHQEVVAYCRENSLNGIVGDDAEYLVFDPPRYFSARNLKLTFKGLIETKEYLVAKLAEGLGLDTQGLCILVSLLGNYLLPDSQLNTVHNLLQITSGKEPVDVVKVVADYVKNLTNTESLDSLAIEIFGDEKTEAVSKRRQLFVESVQYYMNGTKDGFLKYKPRKASKKKTSTKDGDTSHDATGDSDNHDSSRFASETLENEVGSLEAYAQLADGQRKSTQFLLEDKDEISASGLPSSVSAEINGAHAAVNGTNGSDSPLNKMKHTKEGTFEKDKDGRKIKTTRLPPEVLRTAGERHQKGVMSPLIYQILTQSEIKLPVLLEDDHQRELGSVHSIYRPIRQSIYAILFNLHHQMYLANKEQGDEKVVTELPVVKEWTYPYIEPEQVKAEPISWPVPTIQRLWFGTNIEDMRRRLRAYLTCMKSDSPLMVSAAYVPQHLLVMASVLRYLMQAKVPVLRQLELDAFIVTAFCPDLMDSEYTQDLQLQVVTQRGVHLATLFMQGVETAILANEACGAPIPYLMCSPWLYFDGKLFHNILAKTEYVKSLQELCNHRMDVLVKVERMRHAVLENLHVQYARRCVANTSSVLPFVPAGMVPAGYNAAPERRVGPMRGNQRRTVSARGGHLEVAGVVVCSWGANYSLGRERNQSQVGVGQGRGINRNYLDRAGVYPPATNQGRGNVTARRRLNPPRRSKGKKIVEKKGWGRGITDANNQRKPGHRTNIDDDSSSDESRDGLNGDDPDADSSVDVLA